MIYHGADTLMWAVSSGTQDASTTDSLSPPIQPIASPLRPPYFAVDMQRTDIAASPPLHPAYLPNPHSPTMRSMHSHTSLQSSPSLVHPQNMQLQHEQMYPLVQHRAHTLSFGHIPAPSLEARDLSFQAPSPHTNQHFTMPP